MEGESEKKGGNKYEALAERCRNLEASLATLREQFDKLSSGRQDQMVAESSADSAAAAGGQGGDATRSPSSSYPGWGYVSGAFLSGGSPYKKILDCMGHALHVSRPTSTHQIIYWNKCAEKLYGYKEDEVMGESGIELLASEEEDHEWIRSIEERIWSRNDSWSGLFPCKKRSGHTFMAVVIKTPLYDDDGDEVSGVITVSSDASILNVMVSPTLYPRPFQKRPRSRPLFPPIASYVANMASKIFSKEGRSGEDEYQIYGVEEVEESSLDCSTDARWHNKPPRAPPAASKVFFSKLNIVGIIKLGKDKFGNKHQPNGSAIQEADAIHQHLPS